MSAVEAPSGTLALRLYGAMRRAEVVQFFAPEAYPYNPSEACAFLRKLADEMEAHQRKEYPDGMPF